MSTPAPDVQTLPNGMPLSAEDVSQLEARLAWFIRLRWAVVGLLGLSLLVLAGLHRLAGEDFQLMPLAGTALFLTLANLVFGRLHRRSTEDSDAFLLSRYRFSRTVFYIQVAIDYLGLTYVIWSYGFLGMNLAILYLPHILIAAVIFESRRVGLYALLGSVVLMSVGAMRHHHAMHTGILPKSLEPAPILEGLLFVVGNTALFIFTLYLVAQLVESLSQRKRDVLAISSQLVNMDREKQLHALRTTHELKAPFTAIQSYVRLILDGYVGEVTPKTREILHKIEVRCQTLSRMIKDLIQLSNLKTSVFEDKAFQDVVLSRLLENRLESFRERAEHKKVALTLNLEGAPEDPVLVIPNLFEILVDNLIENALQYTPSGKQVEVRLQRTPEGLLLEVADQGIGIPAEHLENIFKEYFRCSNAASFYREGNGMGLAIVQNIVRLHRGQVKVTSTVGQGTTFSISFPEESVAGPSPVQEA